jgi:hypothetical protein
MFEAAAEAGLVTIGLFTVEETIASWWWPFLDAWIASARM